MGSNHQVEAPSVGVGGRGGVPDFIRDEEARHHPVNVEITDNGDRSRARQFLESVLGWKGQCATPAGLGVDTGLWCDEQQRSSLSV